MNETELFDGLQDFLWKSPFDYCIVYRVKSTEAGTELRWRCAMSPYRTREEHDKLAATYHEVAMHCYQNERDFVLQEDEPDANDRGQLWCGLLIHNKPKKTMQCENYPGQQWRHFIIGTGATRKAGYVIIARVVSKDTKEILERIACIQEIMSQAGQ